VKNRKGLNLFQVIGIYLGVSVIANMTAMFSVTPLYRIIRSERDWNYMIQVLQGTDPIMHPLTFLVPSLVAFIYLFPVYAPFFPGTSRWVMDDRSRRRAVNAPPPGP
jgi:hypothetical protein